MRAYEHSFRAMGSPCRLLVYAQHKAQMDSVCTSVVAEVERLEAKYSRYRESSLLSQINSASGTNERLPIDEETLALLNVAETAYQLSDGLFDISSGVLRKGWDFHHAVIPTQRQLNKLLNLIDWRAISIVNNSIRLPEKGMELDFGGLVKEYAVDCAVSMLKKLKLSALVDLGGDIAVTGPQPDGRAWLVGVRHPSKGAQFAVAHLPLSEGAVASSGSYERCIEHNGQRYHHILNPKNGYPIEHCLTTVSVWAPQCTLAGMASTIALLKGNEGLNWLKQCELPFLAIDKGLNTYCNLNEENISQCQ